MPRSRPAHPRKQRPAAAAAGSAAMTAPADPGLHRPRCRHARGLPAQIPPCRHSGCELGRGLPGRLPQPRATRRSWGPKQASPAASMRCGAAAAPAPPGPQPLVQSHRRQGPRKPAPLTQRTPPTPQMTSGLAESPGQCSKICPHSVRTGRRQSCLCDFRPECGKSYHCLAWHEEKLVQRLSAQSPHSKALELFDFRPEIRLTAVPSCADTGPTTLSAFISGLSLNKSGALKCRHRAEES
mmetsp:Transcript_56108/g.163943  ORF Transcript_56108/g.163943 Transcript_56108/m.163943 type:complete len:240 (+) Transcript_56108:1207-1926(+)